MATFHEQFLKSVKESTENPTDFANIKQPLLHYTGKLWGIFVSVFWARLECFQVFQWRSAIPPVSTSSGQSRFGLLISLAHLFQYVRTDKGFSTPSNFKGPLSALWQFLPNGDPLKMMKMFFISPQKLYSFLRYSNFCPNFLCSQRKATK